MDLPTYFVNERAVDAYNVLPSPFSSLLSSFCSIFSFRIVSTPRSSREAPQHGAGVREGQCPEGLLVLYEAIPGAQAANLHPSIWGVKGAHQVSSEQRAAQT